MVERVRSASTCFSRVGVPTKTRKTGCFCHLLFAPLPPCSLGVICASALVFPYCPVHHDDQGGNLHRLRQPNLHSAPRKGTTQDLPSYAAFVTPFLGPCTAVVGGNIARRRDIDRIKGVFLVLPCSHQHWAS